MSMNIAILPRTNTSLGHCFYSYLFYYIEQILTVLRWHTVSITVLFSDFCCANVTVKKIQSHGTLELTAKVTLIGL
jgi:hypothetical protein